MTNTGSPRHPPPYRVWQLPTWLLGQVANHSHRLVLEHLGRAETRSRYAVLAALEEGGEVCQADLCRTLSIDRSDMAAIVGDAESDDLVARVADRYDRRRQNIKLTVAGRDLLERMQPQVHEAQGILLSPLSARERQQLVDLLQKVLIHHSGAHGDAGEHRDR